MGGESAGCAPTHPRLNPLSEFAALSYVWGGVGENHGLVNNSLPADVPLVIDDAMEATRRLGYRYLWIDRYCTPQDNHGDKHIQIQKMNAVYGSATVTVIAAGGDDPAY